VPSRNTPEHLSILVLMLNNITESQKNVQQFVNYSAKDKNLERNTEGWAMQ
jgi:hypothetical protein